MYRDIQGFESFVKMEPVSKGWSSDKKYDVKTTGGERLFLRISDVADYKRLRTEYDLLERAAAFNVPASRPVGFGLCDVGKHLYTLTTWLDGQDADIVMSSLSGEEQYALGVRAGELLRQIHSIPAPDDLADWAKRYFATLDVRFAAYHRWNIRFEGDTYVLQFLDNNRALLRRRPQCQLHGDFHPGNLIVDGGGKLSVVDWLACDFGGYGDPWQDFLSPEEYPQFTFGQLRGYFGGDPPIEFWMLHAYYTTASALTSIAWATDFGQALIEEKLELNRNVLRWFDNMRNPVPTWYQNINK